MKRSLALLSLLIFAASAAGFAQKDRKYVVLKRATPAAVNAPFSDAVRVRDTLYISGHIGFDPATGKPGATPEQEARLVMDAIQRTVEAAGMSMDDLVSVQVYCSDVSLFDTFNGVYRSYFHGNYPARAFVGSGKLLFGARYEVMGVAVKRKQ